jgi:type IV pilus assembly protein PilQ
MRLRSLAIPSLVLLALGIPVVGAGESPAPAQLSETVTIETSDKPLETVLQWISRRAGVNIVCYEQDQPRVTVRLANVTWQEAVESISSKYDLVIEKKSPRVWVLTRPPKVSMSFQDASLPVVLEAIARAADVNIIMAGDVAGSGKRLSMTLKGVPWRYALDVVVKTVDLAWVEQEYNIIRIVSPSSLQKDQRTYVLRVNYGDAKNLGDSLKPAMGDGSIQVDDVSNSLILTGTPVAIEAARRLADQLDQRTREVLIEMKFVDYSTTDVQGLGFDPISLNFDIENIGRLSQEFKPFGNATQAWTTQTALARGATGPTNSRLLSAAAAFEAIATLDSTDIIQSPQILTLDNTEAEITIGRELRFAEQSITQENGQTVRTLKEAQTSPVKDGIRIKVKPHISADGYVQISLDASNSEAILEEYVVGAGTPTESSIQLPQKTSTDLKHTIMVGDGRTAVIGGLLKDKDVKRNGHVPGLGTLPVLGFFFRKERQEVEKRNLTIFITPRIIPLGKKTDYDRSLEELKASLSGVREEAPKDQQADGQAPALTE